MSPMAIDSSIGRRSQNYCQIQPNTKRSGSGFKQCATCKKCFERKDALRRHEKIHDSNRPPLKPRKKACCGCIRSKIRCHGERPRCAACVRRGITCFYEQDKTQNHENDNPARLQDNSTTIESNPISLIQHQQHRTNSLGMESNDTPRYVSVSDLDDTNAAPNAFTDLTLSGPFFQGDIQTSFDWMFDANFDDMFAANASNIGQTYSRTDVSDSGMATAPVRVLKVGCSAVHDAATAFSQGSPVDRLDIPATALRERYPEDRWPMEWSAAPIWLSALPALGELNEMHVLSKHFSTPQLDGQNVSSLQELLKVPLERYIWPDVSMSAFPSTEVLDFCIDRYFVHFDKWVPVIHRPTFDPRKEPVLTLAMVTIGACFTGFSGAHAFSTSLSELCRRLLVYMAEYDPRFVRSEYYVTAQLLQSIHGFSSGSKHLYELSERNRSALVSNARCMGLFDHYEEQPTTNTNDESRWHSWIRAERYRRLAWAVYEYDTHSCTMRDDRPYVRFNEIKMDLPCAERHWKAETEQAWAALHPWTDSLPRSATFESCLADVLRDPQSNVARLEDNYHKHLMVITLTRLLWSNKEATTQPGAKYLSSYNALIQTRKDLLRIVQLFSGSPRAIPTPAKPRCLESLVMRLHLVSAAYYMASDDITDYMHLIWRRSPQSSYAQQHISRWINGSPREFRYLTFAAAQLLTLSRMYPYNHPKDPYDAFHAGMALWVMSKLFSDEWMRNIANSTTHHELLPTCNLDWLGTQDAQEALILQHWLATGDPCVVRMHGVPDVFSRDGPKQILQQTAEILGNMSVWGIGQTLLNATLRVLHAGD